MKFAHALRSIPVVLAATLAFACASDVGEEPVEQIASELVVYPPLCSNAPQCASGGTLPVCASPLGTRCRNGRCVYTKLAESPCQCIAGEIQSCVGGTTRTCIATGTRSTKWDVCK